MLDICGTVREAQSSGSWIAYKQAARKIRDGYNEEKIKFGNVVRAAFLGSFTIEPLIDYIVVEGASENVYIDAYLGGYDQYNQEILNPESGLYRFSPEITLLMVEPESIFTDNKTAPGPMAVEEASGRIIRLVDFFKKNSKGTIFLSTFPADPSWPLHPIDGEREIMVKDVNIRVRDIFSKDTNVRIFDLDRLAAYFGYRNALSPQMMHMARMPFSEGFLALLARAYTSHLKAYKGMTRKCLVLDCDNTLWGGVVGEDGIDEIKLGPDFPGREYIDLQKALLELFDQGVILAVNSRNNFEDTLKVFRDHPHMLLKEKHFASIQINWNDKPSNMIKIAEEINIGLDSMVFLDDSPTERDLMRRALPEVITMELPSNPDYFTRTLRESGHFGKFFLLDEDRKRSQDYASQRQRTELRKSSISMEDFLRGLDMTVTVRSAQLKDVHRIAQLFQRTNQFNLTTRRYTESEIKDMIESEKRRIYTLQVKDKYGDSGMVGVSIVEVSEEAWKIDSFLMSCRVIGRQIEYVLVDRILKDAEKNGIDRVDAGYIKTKKNALAERFWESNGFRSAGRDGDMLKWQVDTVSVKFRAFPYLRIVEE